MSDRQRGRRTRRFRTPLTLQGDRTECAAACLRSVLAYYGRWVSTEELRDACGVGRDGSTAADVLRAARRYGLQAEGWRRPMARIHLAPLPAILFWEFNHFVVLEGVGRGRYHLNDPACGHTTVDEATFDRGYTGLVLQLAPAADFQRSPRPPGGVRRLWEWLREFRPALVLTALLGLLSALVALAVPLLLTVVVDHVLARGQVGWSGSVVALMVGLAAAAWLLTWLQLRGLRRLAVSMAVTRSDRFVTRLFRLPMPFFTARLAGDLLTRLQLIEVIARQGAAQLVSVAVELAMSLAFLGVMFAYSPVLALSVLLLGLACGALVRLIARLRTDYNHRLRREQGALTGLGMAGLRTMQSLRATAGENGFFARWGGYQANELNARQSFEELGHVAGALPGLFLLLGTALVLGLGGWQVAAGNMTVGALMGFYLLAGNFLRPVGRVVQFANELQTIDADLQRLDEVFRGRTAEPGGGRPEGARARIATLNGRLRLAGRVELRNVTFGYQRHNPPLIENLNLIIEPGQRVAVVGPTGSGKSTLSLLVAGVYQPWSGEILFDGHRLQDIPREVFAASVAMVDQHPVLFDATVRENLTFWNPTVPGRSSRDRGAGRRHSRRHRRPARRVRFQRRGRRPQLQRWPAAAPGNRARAGPQPVRVDSGRGYQLAGHLG